MDLLDALKRGEGKTLEFKRDLSSPDGFLKTVVAFANTSGGSLLVGVEDATRHVRGVRDPRATEERIANLISDSIQPRILPDIEVLAYRRTHVVAVQVHPSQSRPHHMKRLGPERGVFVRVGSTTRTADPAMTVEMRRFALGQAFDESPVPELDSEAIDFRAASESFASVRPLKKKDLEALHLIVKHQGRRVPSVGGVLLFGRDRLATFPDAWLQIGRFAGVDREHIVDRRELRGSLLDGLTEAFEFATQYATRGARFDGTRRTDTWSIPPLAVREALINAVAHTDYSQTGAPIRLAVFDDRLEVENPGLLPFGLTIADLPLGVSKVRNRVIGRVLSELGLVEQWGSGVQRMMAACRASGLPAPVFEEIGHRFRVTLKLERIRGVDVDETDATIVAFIRARGGVGTQEVATHVGLSARATRTRLARLVEQGVVREEGTSPKDPRRRYHLAEGE